MRTQFVPIIKTNLLAVYVEIIANYCENHTKHTNVMRRQNAASLDAAVQGAQFYWRALKMLSTKTFHFSALYSNSHSDEEDETRFYIVIFQYSLTGEECMSCQCNTYRFL
jgi:hypothetical protein